MYLQESSFFFLVSKAENEKAQIYFLSLHTFPDFSFLALGKIRTHKKTPRNEDNLGEDSEQRSQCFFRYSNPSKDVKIR